MPFTTNTVMALRFRRLASSLHPRTFTTSPNTMQRPRNRQPRLQNQDRHPGGGFPRQAPSSSLRGPAGTPQQLAGTVPTSSQVVPGAHVHIVLKQDQPTGRETRGVVGDLLSRGDHPRGIKVRLRGSGLVGRVQRMANEAEEEGRDAQKQQPQQRSESGGGGTAPGRFSMRYTDVRNEDEFLDGPPPAEVSLADYIKAPKGGKRKGRKGAQEEAGQEAGGGRQPGDLTGPAVKCPFCEAFEGDEAAVTHHIDRMHLT